VSNKFADEEPAITEPLNWTHVSIKDLMVFSFKVTIAAIPLAASIAVIVGITYYIATH
jgi:hypothetical protein